MRRATSRQERRRSHSSGSTCAARTASRKTASKGSGARARLPSRLARVAEQEPRRRSRARRRAGRASSTRARPRGPRRSSSARRTGACQRSTSGGASGERRRRPANTLASRSSVHGLQLDVAAASSSASSAAARFRPRPVPTSSSRTRRAGPRPTQLAQPAGRGVGAAAPPATRRRVLWQVWPWSGCAQRPGAVRRAHRPPSPVIASSPGGLSWLASAGRASSSSCSISSPRRAGLGETTAAGLLERGLNFSASPCPCRPR